METTVGVARRGTGCEKWDGQPPHPPAPGRELLPMWVADADFAAPAPVLEAVAARAAHGVFGYPTRPGGLAEAFAAWAGARYGLRAEPGELLFTPGVVTGLALAIRALTAPGDGIIIQPPVYHPFAKLVRANGRRLVENPLLESGGRWTMDLEGLERAADRGCRMLILCSPHNPAGRVWSAEELEGLARLCAGRGVILASDEIHADLVLPGSRHRAAATVAGVDPELLISFYAPSKTWNIAGLQTSIALPGSAAIRAKMEAELASLGLGTPSVFGGAAAEAAYRGGAPWLESLLETVSANAKLLREGLAAAVPEAVMSPLEGTYLAFVDFRRAIGRRAALRGDCAAGDPPGRLLLERAALWVDEGAKFGGEGSGWARLNLACPRANVEEALSRIAEVLG